MRRMGEHAVQDPDDPVALAFEVALARVRRLPTVNTETAAAVLGMSYWALLRAVDRGDAPVRHWRRGRHIRWVSADLLRFIGRDAEA